MRRLRKHTMYRGLLSAKMITREDIPVLERRLLEVDRYTELNKMFTINRGHRFIDKMRAFGKWLYTHREEIFRILGIVVMLMDDGTEKLMTVEDAEKLEASRKPKPKRKRKPKKAQPVEETPDGEKVYDFVMPEVAAEVTAEIEAGGLDETPKQDDEDASRQIPEEVDGEESHDEEGSN